MMITAITSFEKQAIPEDAFWYMAVRTMTYVLSQSLFSLFLEVWPLPSQICFRITVVGYNRED